MSLLGRNITANLFSNIWLAALMLILAPLYVRFLGVESYGLIGFYLSWIIILGILDTGISATATREIAWLSARPQEKEKIPILVRSMEVVYWGIIFFLGALILVGAWLFGMTWFQAKSLSPELIQQALMLMAISLIFQVPSGLYSAGLMGLQRQVECSSLLAFFGTVRGVGALLVLWKVYPDIRVFFLWQIVASVLQVGVMRKLLWEKVKIDGVPARFSLDILHSVKGFAGGMLLITFLGIIITQADKMILSKMIPLEVLGFYMLAWTVSSGLSRVAAPLTLAFSPHFTELVSKGDNESLIRKARIFSQMMSVLILPPAALIAFLSKPILYAWTGSWDIAIGASSILTVMVAGTAFSICSYPALSVLYSRKHLRPVIVTSIAALFLFLPLLVLAVVYFGAIGAAFCWGLYGLVQYFVYQSLGLRGIAKVRIFSFMLQDFVNPCIVSFVFAYIASYLLVRVENKIFFTLLLGLCLVVGCVIALSVCKDLRNILSDRIKCKKNNSL